MRLNILSRLSFIALILVSWSNSILAYAEQSFYIGSQIGFGKPDYGDIFTKTISLVPNHHADDNGLAERFYIGYQLNSYFGAESGYSLFSDNRYKANNPVNNTFINLTVATEVWDILAKVGLPFENSRFRGDIKAGAADVMSEGNLTSNIPGFKNSASENNWSPIAGASLSYHFNRHFAGDISYLHIFGSPNIDKNLDANANLITIGIQYYFV